MQSRAAAARLAALEDLPLHRWRSIGRSPAPRLERMLGIDVAAPRAGVFMKGRRRGMSSF